MTMQRMRKLVTNNQHQHFVFCTHCKSFFDDEINHWLAIKLMKHLKSAHCKWKSTH